LWSYSKNELRTNYLNQKYILMTSANQMAVLQYNNNDMLLLDELSTVTNVGKDLPTHALQPLVKFCILINEGADSDQDDLNPRAFYSLIE
jgi:cullin 1